MGIFHKRKFSESTGVFDKLSSLFGLNKGGNNINSDPLYNSAFWACIMNLSKIYATLPLHAYRADGKGGAVCLPNDHYLNKLMEKPNKYMTSYSFWFVMGYNLEMHGEAIALLERNRNGIITAMYPVSPSTIVKYIEDGEMMYSLGNGTKVKAADVLDILATPTSFNSVLSPVQYASDAVDLDKRVKKMQSDYLAGGSVIGNVISVPSRLDDEGLAKIKAMFDSSAGGFKNYVIRDGVTVTPIHVNNGDIGKLTEASNWTAKEIARRFQVPPFFIGDTSVPMGNAEQQGLEMVTYCIGPRVKAIEIAINAVLCRSSEYYKFSLQGLMRGDHAARSAFYHNAVMDGWMSPNEVRALEELGPIDFGNEHFFPMNYATLKDIAEGKFANNGSPWDLPSAESVDIPDHGASSLIRPFPHTPQQLSEAERLAEKKRHDIAFFEEATKPVKTSRQKLEKLIRKQLKAEIAELKRLIEEGGETGAVLQDWAAWLETYAAELQPEYKQLYIDVIKKMLPVVKKEVESDIEVEDDRIEGFADTYANNLMGRHTGHVKNEMESVVGTDKFEDKAEALKQDYPVVESKEEANRSTNAFSVFLYGALGLEYMHSVARADACEFCQKLDGKVCSVNGYILNKGAEMKDGEGGIRKIKKNYRHPPYHGNCSCFMAPGK